MSLRTKDGSPVNIQKSRDGHTVKYHYVKHFPLDHFGIVSSQFLEVLLKQVQDKKGKRSAFSRLEKIAKQFKQIPQGDIVEDIGLLTGKDGVTRLAFNCVGYTVIPQLATNKENKDEIIRGTVAENTTIPVDTAKPEDVTLVKYEERIPNG